MDANFVNRWKIQGGFTHFRDNFILKPATCHKCKGKGYIPFGTIYSPQELGTEFQEAADGHPLLYGNVCGNCLGV